MADHDALIDALSHAAGPVKRPLPAGLRAAAWAAAALPCGALFTFALHRAPTDWSRAGAGWALLELAAAFPLGGLAMATAFDLAIAGRRAVAWPWMALGATIWLAASLASVAASPDPIGRIGAGVRCYAFLIVAGAPMAALAVAGIRRTRAVRPDRALAMAGLGVALLAVTLLTLCHAVESRLIDLSMHLAAGATLVAATVFLGRRWVAMR